MIKLTSIVILSVAFSLTLSTEIVNVRDEIIEDLGGIDSARCHDFFTKCGAYPCLKSRSCSRYSSGKIYEPNTKCEVEKPCMPGYIDISAEVGKGKTTCQSFIEECTNSPCHHKYKCYTSSSSGSILVADSKCWVADPCSPPSAPEGMKDVKFDLFNVGATTCDEFFTQCGEQPCHQESSCSQFSSGTIYIPNSKCLVSETCGAPETQLTTTPETPTATEEPVENTFQQQALAKHNEYRAKHHKTPPTTTNTFLVEKAQWWADHMASTGTFAHSTNAQRTIDGKYYGENLGYQMSSAGAPDGLNSIDSWYNEIKIFDWSTHKMTTGYIDPVEFPHPAIGHFTQMVWANTTELGCAQALNGFKTYTCCWYGPGGNYVGQYEQQVRDLI